MTVIRGDARHLPLADESVDLIVTEPVVDDQLALDLAGAR